MAQQSTPSVAGEDAHAGRPSHTMRRRTRAVVMRVLYEVDSAGHDPDVALRRRLEEQPLPEESEAFARRLVRGVLEHRAALDQVIATFAPAWPLSQMAPVDRSILRMAIFEITRGGETPPKVAINEAVEIAKSFGSDRSPAFVNGVLGSVMASIEQGVRPPLTFTSPAPREDPPETGGVPLTLRQAQTLP